MTDLPKANPLEPLRTYARDVLKLNPDDIHIEGIHGVIVYLLRTPQEIAVELNREIITLGLSNMNRYSGQTLRPYSVAEHSVYVAYAAHLHSEPIEVIRACALHDITECILSDIPAPLKQLLPDYYLIEDNMMRAMLIALGLNYEKDYEPYASTVKQYDLLVLGTEMRQLNMGAYPKLVDSYSAGLSTRVEDFVKGSNFHGPYQVSSYVAKGALNSVMNLVLNGINPFEGIEPISSPTSLVKLQLCK